MENKRLRLIENLENSIVIEKELLKTEDISEELKNEFLILPNMENDDFMVLIERQERNAATILRITSDITKNQEIVK